ncbi:hypothetical protein [Asticcacaulis sp. 201]|uniref:hypothetical protein n=1 Tax=Asticcacaulis sp. 201 TaxID=3028787 RepID=UPI0029168D9F|nr:hypothetical protein [Asticcacaulis sp. 201]MDV6331331.1 hypothetical protein [Asticcacaulis sp. 201]
MPTQISMTRNAIYLVTVAALLAVFAGLAILFGYISVDSWYYMLLTQALRSGHGCSLHGEYLAVYPCGYPTVLALTAPSTDPAALMISSKITNLILLAASFWLVLKASRNVFLAALVVLNPITLIIGMYTWSENLLLFCFCGIFFAISEIHRDDRQIAGYAWLAAFLFVGCFARYFFGPFAFILFVCAWIAYGRRTAWRIFPVFCGAGLVFLGYQAFNYLTTGFATGMPRVAAPEAPLLLIRQFLIALGINGLGAVICAVLLVGISFRRVSVAPMPVHDTQRPAALFITLAGLGFLALAFILRFRTLFDPYNTRTIGYGIALTVAGLVGLWVREMPREARRGPAIATLIAMMACAGFSLAYADNGALVQSIEDSFQEYKFPAGSLAMLKGQTPPADAMVFFKTPVPDLGGANVDNIEEIYYGKGVTLLTPRQGPDNAPETPLEFLHRVADVASKRCYFDFTPFATRDDFQAYLGATTLIDHKLLGIAGPWKNVERANLNPDMGLYLDSIFQPKKLVPCREILYQPQSRQVVTKKLP